MNEQPKPWTARDDERIAHLRRAELLTEAERQELRHLRRRETIEATSRRIAYFKRVQS